MGEDNRWDSPPGQDPQGQDWGDRYRRIDRDDRRYGAGDFEGSQNYQARYGAESTWPGYDPGRGGVEYRDRGGEERGWERTAASQGYGPDQGERAGFAGWDAPFGGRPRHDDRADAWSRARSEGRSFLDRTREELASLFGAGRRDDEPQRREGDFRGTGPKGYRRSDDRIREDVHDRLTEDSWLDASGIEVSVHEGEVTLDGKVRTRADKRRAEDLVEHVSGVGHVQNNLRADVDKRDHLQAAPLI